MRVLARLFKGKISPKLFILGGLLVTSGFLTLGIWKPVYKAIVWSSIKLKYKNRSFFYNKWKSNEEATYSAFYLFNWTNPEETLTRKSKPKFVEVGPFVYRRRHLKEKITWNHNDTVTYGVRHRYDFVENLSPVSQNVEITSINPVAVVLLNHFEREAPAEVVKVVQNTLFEYIERSLYITRPAKEFLFTGYGDVLLNIIWLLRHVYPQVVPQLPLRFAWLYKRNLTARNYVNVYSGNSDKNKLGLIHSYDYKKRVSSLPAPCSSVRGTIGDLWPHNAAEQREHLIFVPELLSTFRLQKVESSEVHGIDGQKFESSENTFDNGVKLETNRCYCPGSSCHIKYGIRNLSTLFQMPFYASHPHFYAADSSYRTVIDGMNPDAKKHQSRIVLEKEFGVILDLHIKLQLNVQLEPIGAVHKNGKLGQLPKILIPTFWRDEYFNMTEDQIDRCKFIFKTIPITYYVTIISLFSMGTIAFIVASIIKCRGEIAFDRKSYTVRT